jgi:Icc-related predicted phosphoesterase
MILGNDDGRAEEAELREAEARGLWTYTNERRSDWGDLQVYGYCYVPPTPFRLKDWERYDLSRYVPPGSLAPEEGITSIPIEIRDLKRRTISQDLVQLAGEDRLERAIFLFHAPPYQTKLDRAALDGKMFDHVPLDVHIGSIAMRRFIEARQPLLTLHGHVHESARLTGSWRDRIGRTHLFSAAHDGPELALVRFDLENLEAAWRELR